MKRRTFLQAASGLVASLFLPIEKAKIAGIDLRPFCADHSGILYDMRRPFNQQGYTYAGSQALVMRTNLITDLGDVEPTKLPPASRLPWGIGSGFEPMNAVRRKRHDTLCDVACPTCGGQGNICGPLGEALTCPECDGSGEVDYEYDVCGLAIAPRWIDLMSRHLHDIEATVVKFTPIVPDAAKVVLAVRFAGGEGMIAPLSRY